jgi:hypothetical protein
MKRALIAPVIAFGGLAGCAQTKFDGPSATDRSGWELLALLLVGMLLFVALSSLLALLSRRAPHPRSRRTHAHRHRDRLIDSGQGPDRGIVAARNWGDDAPPILFDRGGASAPNSVTHPTAP